MSREVIGGRRWKIDFRRSFCAVQHPRGPGASESFCAKPLMMRLRGNRSVGQRFDRGYGPPVRIRRQTRISRSLYSVDCLLARTKDDGKKKK